MPKASSYSEKFKDPRWQRKRLEVFERDGFKCRRCGTSDSQLHAHHFYYIARRDPWEYPLGSLETLCDGCHEYESSDDGDDWGPNTAREWEIMFETGIPGSGYEMDFAYEFKKWREKSGLSVDRMVYKLMLTMQCFSANSVDLETDV
jgi:hypothetical protein